MTRGLDRRAFLLGSVSAALFAACADGNGAVDGNRDVDSGGGTTMPPELLRSERERAAAEDPTGAASLLRPFSLALYGRLASEAAGNLLCSPTSVAVTLAMAANGGAGATADEVVQALGATSLDELNRALNAVGRSLDARSGARQGGPGREGEVTLRLANDLWGQAGMDVLQPFLDVLATHYGAGLQLVDFVGATEEARRTINASIAEDTGQRIPQLLAPGVLSVDTRLVLTNALHLLAPWQEPFGPAVPGSFTLDGGERIEVDTMQLHPQLARVGNGPGWTAVELPYLGGELAMLIVVPDAGGWAAFEQDLNADVLVAVAAALRRAAFDLWLPKWTTRTSSSLPSVLEALGIVTAFDEVRADFSAITTDQRLHISDVVHEAYIAVDEQGTEAAAATAVVINAVSAHVDPPQQVHVDRPFLYAIRDVQSDAILFVGRVLDPRQR